MRRLILPIFFLALHICAAGQTPREIAGVGITGKIFRYEKFPSGFAEARNVDVWLPADYSAKKKYAVIYMHDGQNLFNPGESFGGVDWGVDETMTGLMKAGKIRDAIVVGIWNTPKRTLEYMPQKAFTANPVVDAASQKGDTISTDSGSDRYLRFIVEELKPFIDQNYKTRADRKNTFVMGSSMGGLMALYAISEYPQIFGGAGCVSTHFPLGKGAMLEYMRRRLALPKNHKIYFDYGTKTLDAEYEPYQLQADAIMREKGYQSGKNWITRKFPGAEHSEKSWRERVRVPLAFLLEK